jgi:nicotinate phosphoribosyltransferase
VADSLLLTDLYQLSMLAAYYDEGMTDTAAFEFFVRELPPGRNFLLAAGLEPVLDFLAGARFAADELDWLAGCGRFRRDLADRLADWRFTGRVDAMPEDTVFFPDEPILRVALQQRGIYPQRLGVLSQKVSQDSRRSDSFPRRRST